MKKAKEVPKIKYNKGDISDIKLEVTEAKSCPAFAGRVIFIKKSYRG